MQAITRELQRTPPPLAGTTSNVASPSIPISKNIIVYLKTNTALICFVDGEIRASPINYQTFSPSVKNFSPPLHIPHPSYLQQSVAFPELADLSLEELQFLNENLDRQDEFVDELPLIKEQNKTLDELLSNVEELAGRSFT